MGVEEAFEGICVEGGTVCLRHREQRSAREPKGGLQQDVHRDKVQRQDLGLDW